MSQQHAQGTAMTVEKTIEHMMTKFPELFITRSDCFDQLFITIGNGYDWVKGQLVLDGLGNEDLVEDYDGFEHIADIPYVLPKGEFKKRMDERIRRFEMFEIRKPVGIINNWSYSWSEKYSKIVNFPDDIKEDWKKAIKECVALMKGDKVPYAGEVIYKLKSIGFTV